MSHLMKKQNLSTFLKNKTRSYSAQAAITSFAVHLLLIIFAGSIVAVRYVQKQNAELIARTEARPKMERKKLQAPAARVEQLQQRSLTSKLVSKKVSFTNPKFVLPDTGKIGSLKTQKLSLPGANAGRALSSLNRVTSIGPSSINFFGIRAEGEKVVFVIDASAAMLDEHTGGSATYDYIKGELLKIVSELKPSMLFNLIFYDQQRVYMFRPNLVPATRETAAALTEWVRAVNGNPEQAGLLPEQNNYQSPVPYETAVGSDAKNWLLALQAALEQQADTVMILGSGWGHHQIGRGKAASLLDYAMWELLVGTISSAPELITDRKLRDDLLKGASTALDQNEKLRKAKTIPTGYVRDVAQYVEYSIYQVLGHLDFVCQSSYSDHGLSKPNIHFVCLTETGNRVVAGGAMQNLSALMRRYNGQLEFLRRDSISESTEIGALQTAVADESRPAAPPVTFFGAEGTGSRVAFILDASGGMLSDESGGTFSYSFIKEQMLKSVTGLQTGVQFNVILHNGQQTALFQPRMVPATPANIAALKHWLAPVNSDPSHPGFPEKYASGSPLKDYGTIIGTDSSGWLRALQTAMEQKSDTVFITGTGWGNQMINREKGHKLLDFSIWDLWISGGTLVNEDNTDSSSTTVDTSTPQATTGSTSIKPISLKSDEKQRSAFVTEALKAIGEENRIRKAQGKPQPFVRDILSYLRYTADQITAHLNTVVQADYTANGAPTPVINFICLAPAESEGNTVETDRNLNKLTGDYAGSLVLFRGAGSNKEMMDINRGLDSMDWQVPAESP